MFEGYGPRANNDFVSLMDLNLFDLIGWSGCFYSAFLTIWLVNRRLGNNVLSFIGRGGAVDMFLLIILISLFHL